MIFKQLYIKDFMKIKEVSFSLNENDMIVLQGSNGQGKSAAFEAMAMLLINHRKGTSVKHYIRRGCTKFIVRATLVKKPGGDPYEIDIECSHRTMPPTSKTVTFRGATYKNSEYDVFMRTQFDADLIDNITFSMQGDNDLSKFKPAQLRDLLKTVFKISFDQEQEKVHSLASYYREEERELGTRIAAMLSSLDILKRDEPILTRPPSSAKLEALREDVETLSSSVADRESQVRVLDDVSREIASLESQQQKQEQLVTYHDKSILNIDFRIKNVETDLIKAQLDRDLILGSLEGMQTADIKGRERFQQIQSIWEDISKLRAEEHTLQHRLGLIKEDSCPTCHQKLPPDWINNSQEYLQKVDTIQASVGQLETEVGRLKSEIEQMASINKKKDKIDHVIETQETQLADLRSALETAKNDPQHAEVLQHLNVIKSQVASKKEEGAKLQTELLDVVKEKEELELRLGTRREELREMETSLNSFAAKQEILQDNHRRREEIDLNLKTSKGTQLDAMRKLEVYEVAEKLVDKYLPTYGVLLAGEKVVQGMLNIIRPVLPDWNLRLVPSREGVYFEYQEGEETEWSPISLSSGFENALCNIAFKLTLTAYYGLPLMILDEIDAAAVDENSYKVFDSLHQFKQVYGIHQIWLVSHKKDVVAKIVQEYGAEASVYQVHNGEFSRSWIGGATQ